MGVKNLGGRFVRNINLRLYVIIMSRTEYQSECTLYSLPEFQGTPSSKQAPYLKFKWQQRDSNSQPFNS